MPENVNIKIYRGANQIGGCATEISCGEERILIDLGANLPGTDETCSMSDEDLLAKVFDGRSCKGVLFTHYHGDHYGLFRGIPEETDMFIGKTAREIVSIVAKTLEKTSGKGDVEKLAAMKTFSHKEAIFADGKIKVIPLMTDHSAMDSYMFLVEALGKKILFTGDFRDHGIASEHNRFWEMAEENIPKDIDVLITEGTMLSREKEAKKNIVRTEEELGRKAKEYCKECKYNFVLVSSTNLDTIMELYRNTPKGKMFIVDSYQAEIMLTAMQQRAEMFEKYGAFEIKNGEFCKPIYVIGKKKEGTHQVMISKQRMKMLRDMAKQIHPNFHIGYADYTRMTENGFVMLIRPNRYKEIYENCFEEAIREFSDKKVQLIYSMWKGYIEGDKTDQDIRELTRRFEQKKDLHTSGHAYVETLAEFIKRIAPKVVIPMHTEFAQGFQEKEAFSAYKGEVVLLEDLENYEVK